MKWNLNEKHLDIAKVLVKAIKEGQTITYKELAINVGMSVERNSDLYSYLGDLSYYSFENGMPLISVVVVRKEEKMPGAGFYGVYKEKRGITVAKSKQMEVFVDELKRVLGYSEWDKLIELLKKEKIENEEVEFIEINELEDTEEEVIEEGKYIKRIIEAKKRNPKVRKMKIEQFKKDNNGRVFCEICNEEDIVVLDVHHDLVQVADMKEGHKTKLSELRVLCSNCHRKVYGHKTTVDELIKSS